MATSYHHLLVLLLGLSLTDAQDELSCSPGWILQGEKCYFFSVEKVPWPQASSYCNAFGAVLAEPLTTREMTFLGSKVMQLRKDYYFIGVTDFFLEGKWVYASTRTPVESIPWWRTPDNWQDEDCIIVGNSIGGKWADAHCRDSYLFICEYPATYVGDAGVIIG